MNLSEYMSDRCLWKYNSIVVGVKQSRFITKVHDLLGQPLYILDCFLGT